MTTEKKLELTLCGMLPYGLQINTKNEIRTLVEQMPNEYFSNSGYSGNDKIDIALCIRIGIHKPLLHSLNKLTEPILEGGLIPIVELAKIHDKKINWCLSGQSAVGNGYTFYYDMAYGSFVGCYGFPVIPNPINFQIELFEKLKEWHFNIYDLPKEMYIEKSNIRQNNAS